MILFAIQHQIEGPFNGTAPNPETMSNILKLLARQLHRPLILPNIPAFALRLIFGKERHKLLLTDQKIHPKRMLDAGFKFQFNFASEAFQNIYKA
jgi:NAD dependent epimerase/dehydratase family enzyme